MPKRKTFINKINELKAKPTPRGEPDKRLTLKVPGAEGLYVRATDKGKTFTVIARRKRDRKQIWAAVPIDEIGVDIDTITEEQLDAVRALAREGIANIKRGERKAFPPPPAGPDSLQKVAENFMRRHVRKEGLVSADEIERQLKTYCYPVLGDVAVNDIKRSDIANLLDQIEDDHGATQADRVLATLRKLFNWYTARDDEFVSPVVKGMARTKPAERRRERVLSDHEIKTLWPILTDSSTFGAIVKMLLITGQRLDKVRNMKWTDIDDGTWTIPVAHKREKANAGELPLPRMAIEIIEAQPKIVGNPFVFAGLRHNGPFNGAAKGKVRLDKRFREALDGELEPWVLHSLRHTAKTLMARVRVSDFDSERVLGHVIPGIRGTYNHHGYLTEKGAALEKLAAALERIIDPPPADEKVVDFPKAVAE